jgi:DNA-binding transcriptional regulator YiaG
LDDPKNSANGAAIHSQQEDRLDSWKKIASYLKRDASTVQRWERREVIRPAGAEDLGNEVICNQLGPKDGPVNPGVSR